MVRTLSLGLLTVFILSTSSRAQDSAATESGFVPIFNGTDLTGWDGDTENRKASGLFAFRLDSGPPMQIKLKNIRVRKL